MEEEAARREAGEIPESEIIDPAWVMKKDAPPSTIYDIFSNNVSTFNPDSPSNKQAEYNPFSPSNGASGTNIQPDHFGKGAPEEFDLSAGLPVRRNTPDPTMEDVESALAELDSLPDGEGETTAEGEDSAPADDHWGAYTTTMMDQPKQTGDYIEKEVDQQQQQYVHMEAMQPQEAAAEPMEIQASEPIAIPASFETHSGGNSPKSPPSSPRSVEGFVTSVELNTVEEQLTAGGLSPSGAVPEQQSGPFSVYVSSSPEPASLEAVVDATVQKSFSPVPDVETEVVSEVQKSPSPVVIESEQDVVKHVTTNEASVEIVHAQSMVEVVAPPSPTHEPELQFVGTTTEVVTTPSPVYTPAPLDLMSTSMILEHPISNEPEQVAEMMQFMATNPEVIYNNIEKPQTAEVVHIEADSNIFDVEESIESSPEMSCSPNQPEIGASPVKVENDVGFIQCKLPLSPEQQPQNPVIIDDQYALVEQMNRANITAVYSSVQEEPIHVESPISQPMDEQPISEPKEIHSPEPVMTQSPEDMKIPLSVNMTVTSPVPVMVGSPVAVKEHVSEVIESTEMKVNSPTPDFVTEKNHEVKVLEHVTESPVAVSPVEKTVAISDSPPKTPMKEPMINNRPISPIHTPKGDVPPPDADIISEIIPPTTELKSVATKKAPVKAAPRTTPPVRATARPSPTTKTPTTTTVKPGTPRPSARTTPSRATPGGAVRNAATPSTTTRTPGTAAKTTPATRTPLSARTTPSSRSTSATSTSATRASTTTRTPQSSRSATRTTPSSSATKPTPTTRSIRPTTTPSSARSTTTPTTTTRITPSSRPSSATTTPTTTRRVPISRRTPTTTTTPNAKDATDSKPTPTKSPTSTRAPITRKPLYPGPKTATSATAKTTSTGTTTEKKEIKNSTNKMLSSRTVTVTRTTSTASTRSAAPAPTHRTMAAKTTGTPAKRFNTSTSSAKSPTTPTATSKTGQKSKILADKTTAKSEEKHEEINGEVKIAQEETCVEVVTKEENEVVAASIIDVEETTTNMITEVLVNGDGAH